MQFEIAPPAELAGWINTFYVIETLEAQIAEVVPAYSAQMVAIVRGALEIEHAGVSERPGTLAINASQLRAVPCMLCGLALLIGASLTPRGWQALANLPADKVYNQLLAPDAILTGAQNAALVDAAAACAAGRVTPREVLRSWPG